VHLVGPSIWAWRYERIHFIKQAVTRILVVFPFEEAIYQNEGIPVTYVGHPLADEIPLVPDLQAARQRLKLDENSRVIAILPGSRASEIKVLAPRFLATAERLFKKDPNLTFLVPMVNESRRQQFDAIAREFNLPSLRVLTQSDLLGQAARPIAWDALEACDVALVASGTATLETALFKKPMVISYYLPLLMRKMMTWKSKQARPYLDWVGLPNILAKDFIVPELLQDEATPEKLTDAVWRLLVDERKQASIAESFLEIHHTLKRDTATIAAQAILNVANGY
jgi:lipid-A-disaccharide synthase